MAASIDDSSLQGSYDRIRYDDEKVKEIARRLRVTEGTVLAYLRCHAPVPASRSAGAPGGSRSAATNRQRGAPQPTTHPDGERT